MEYNFDNVIYIGIELNNISRQILIDFGKDCLKNGIAENFEPKFFCHHMTVAFYKLYDDKILDWAKQNYGREFNMVVKEVGISDKAFAVKAETLVPTTSKFKHITIATNILTNGKPMDSNYITNWIKLKQNFPLKGRLQFYTR